MQTLQANQQGASTTQTERQWSYTNGTSDTPLLGLTIGDLFDQTVEKYPDHPALIAREQNFFIYEVPFSRLENSGLDKPADRKRRKSH